MFNHRKGVSPLVASILLIAFTMAVASLTGPFFSKVIQSSQEDVKNDVSSSVYASRSNLDIERTSYEGENFTGVLKNSGQKKLENFTITVEGESLKQIRVEKILNPGEVTNFKVNNISNVSRVSARSPNLPVSVELVIEKSSKDSSVEGPTAVAAVNDTNPKIKEIIGFNASSSSEGDSSISNYKWDLDEDGSYDKNGEKVTYSYSSSGRYDVELRVEDKEGLTDTDFVTIDVVSNMVSYFNGFNQFRSQARIEGTTQTSGVSSPVSEKWSFETGDNVEEAPAYYNGSVYFGSDDGNIYALNASTGTKKWNKTLGSVIDSSPAIVNGTLFIGSWDENLYALNASTGSEKWSFQTNGLIRSSPHISEGTVYVGNDAANVLALNSSTGNKKWNYSTGPDEPGERLVSSPYVRNGTVYLGSENGNFYALDAETGSKKWSYSTASNIESSPAASNRMVYIGSGDNNVYALNASTGSEEWSYSTGAEVVSSPSVVNNTVYVGSSDLHLYALDASTGSMEWRFNASDRVESSPAVVDDTVYIGSQSSDLYALDASTGSEEWSFGTGGPVYSSPIVVNGAAYIGSNDNKIYAIE